MGYIKPRLLHASSICSKYIRRNIFLRRGKLPGRELLDHQKKMAIDQRAKLALSVFFLGFLSFLLGVIAENKKPPFGTPIQGKDVIICKYPTDSSVVLGSLSMVALVLCVVAGHLGVYFPYKGVSVPGGFLFRSTTLLSFFIISEILSVAALALMLWTTVIEWLRITRTVHGDITTKCPTAKTGMFGGSAFLGLDAALFWLVCQMLTLNAREDYLNVDDDDENDKGKYEQVDTADA